MKKRNLLFLASLSIATLSFSQTTYPRILNDSLVVITNSQLKQTNTLLNDRDLLRAENKEYSYQIVQYDSIVKNYKRTDYVFAEQLSTLNSQLDSTIVDYNKTIIEKNTLKIKNQKLKKYSFGSTVVGAALLLILLF